MEGTEASKQGLNPMDTERVWGLGASFFSGVLLGSPQSMGILRDHRDMRHDKDIIGVLLIKVMYGGPGGDFPQFTAQSSGGCLSGVAR